MMAILLLFVNFSDFFFLCISPNLSDSFENKFSSETNAFFFQLLAVATPTVFFHFYTMYVSGEIQKLKNAEGKLKAMEEGENGSLLGVSHLFSRLFAIQVLSFVYQFKSPMHDTRWVAPLYRSG